MCIVCVMLDKDKITRGEAMTALWEQMQFAESEADEDHIRELYAELENAESDAFGNR